MQQYFKTGKTIVIDDQYSEAKPLLDSLSRNQIPFLYTQGKPNSDYPLPNSKPEDAQYYNLIFLDLNLDFKFAGSQIGSDSDEKTFKATHAQILNTIIKNKNRSFILIIWSNEEENYLSHYLTLFEDINYTPKKPYKIISLNKSKYFSLTNNGYEFNRDKNGETKQYEDLLFHEINKALIDLEAFKFFCEWDRVISQSVSDAIDDLMGLINEISTEEERENNLANIFTLISIAYSGIDSYLNLSTNEERTDSVFLALTQVLIDDIDRNVLNHRQNEFVNWKAINNEDIKKIQSSANQSLLNKKLLLYRPNNNNLTGSTYKSPSASLHLKRILQDCFEIDQIYKKTNKLLNVKYKKGFEASKSPSNDCLEYIVSKCIPIDINVTPLCDLVQNKYINYRVVSGFIIGANYYSFIKKHDMAYFYKSPIFSFAEKDVFIGIDLRSFDSFSKDEIEQREYLFSLRTNLVNDIQTKLAAHVSRLGVLYL